MTNTPTPTKGVPVQLDRERHLRYTLKTIREMREALGADVLEAAFEGEAIAKLLWYGLKHEDPELTVDAIEDLVDLENLADLMEAVGKATGSRAKIDIAPSMGPQQPAPVEVDRSAEVVAGLAADDEEQATVPVDKEEVPATPV